jgi:hypothetical protein
VRGRWRYLLAALVLVTAWAIPVLCSAADGGTTSGDVSGLDPGKITWPAAAVFLGWTIRGIARDLARDLRGWSPCLRVTVTEARRDSAGS